MKLYSELKVNYLIVIVHFDILIFLIFLKKISIKLMIY